MPCKLDTDQARWLSFTLSYVIGFWLAYGSETAFKVIAGLVVTLLLIWFGDILADLTKSYNFIYRDSPGFAFKLLGWIILVLFPFLPLLEKI
jgi:hypothetical protein